MKSLSLFITKHLLIQGIEPSNILEVQWVKDGSFLQYGDKEVLSVDGVILELSNLESVIKLDSQGQSQSINVTLDDTSGNIKNILNVNDIHGSTVKLYQWFEGTALSERFQLYEGEISSPITWNEGDRTISFAIITKLADKEVGFSPEEGYFPFIPDELVGKPWPMCFGLVQNVPAVRLQDVPTTSTLEDLGVEDPTLQDRIKELKDQKAILQNRLEAVILAQLQAQFSADFGDPAEKEHFLALVERFAQEQQQLLQAIVAIDKELDNIEPIQTDQASRTNVTLQLSNTGGMPQGELITLTIGSIELSGVLTGDILEIDARVLTTFGGTFTDPFGFTFISAGTTITLKNDQPILYIANIITSTVHSIQVNKQTDNGPVLVTIPASWYTVKNITDGPFTFVVLEFSRAPSSRDTTLGDDIFITLTSTIGPNTVDVMIWLIDQYTDLTYDATTFNDVKVKLENYPSHFAKFDRPNILQMLEEVAFQARCAIWIQNNVIFIKYLSEEQDSVDTITETNIDAGSMLLEATNTEELVTKMTATWRDNYALTDKNQIILRHNVERYGTREREFDFYIYNIGSLVLKSATFWLIRFANIWKLVSFDCYVDKLALDTFDTITLDFDQNFVSTLSTKAFINDLIYNTTDGLINITCWLPVRFGEMSKYDFSWPSQILPEIQFPTAEDFTLNYAGGAGPGADVEGDFALTDDQKEDTNFVTLTFIRDSGARDQRKDYGEETPSDLNDTKPEPTFLGVTAPAAGEEPTYSYDYEDHDFEFTPDPLPIAEASVAFIGKLTTDVSAADMINLTLGSGLAELYTIDPDTFLAKRVTELIDDVETDLPAQTIYNTVDHLITKESGGEARFVQIKQIGDVFVIDVVPC